MAYRLIVGGIIVSLLGTLVACRGSGRYVRVEPIVMVLDRPRNLAEDPECVQLWDSLVSTAVKMDSVAQDWNVIVVRAAYSLIDQGCVVRTSN